MPRDFKVAGLLRSIPAKDHCFQCFLKRAADLGVSSKLLQSWGKIADHCHRFR